MKEEGEEMTTPPEIETLNLAAWQPDGVVGRMVPLEAAERAVLAAEERVREEEAKTQEVIHREVERIEIDAARREAFREAVEALRGRDDGPRIAGMTPHAALRAARYIESRFLSGSEGSKG